MPSPLRLAASGYVLVAGAALACVRVPNPAGWASDDQGDATGSGSEAEVGSSSSDSGSSDSSSDTGSTSTTTGTADTGSSDSGSTCPTGGCTEAPPWLLSIDEPTPAVDQLQRISLLADELGTVTTVCANLLHPFDGNDPVYGSLTVLGGVLYTSVYLGAGGYRLARIDPCTCEVTQLGAFPVTQTVAIGADLVRQTLVAVIIEGSSVSLAEIDPQTAAVTPIGEFASGWEASAITGANRDRLYVLDPKSDEMSILDPNGLVQLTMPIEADFFNVALEYHPLFDVIYACGINGQNSALAVVDPVTGTVELTDTGLQGPCRALAAAIEPVACID